MIEDEDPLLLPNEVAKLFRVHPKTISRWAADGKIPSVETVGGHRRFRTSVVKRLLSGEDTWAK